MKIDGIRNKPIMLSTLAVSMFYNLFWVAIFYYLMTLLDNRLHLLTIAFLLFYLLVAQPLRDLIVNNILLKTLYPEMNTDPEDEEEFSNVQTREDIFRYFQRHLKSADIPSVYLLIANNTEQSVHITKNRVSEQLPAKYTNISDLFQYIEFKHDALFAESLPERLRKKSLENGWVTIVPILYRSRMQALAAYPRKLEKKLINRLNPLLLKSALIFENESLTLNVMKNRVFQKEFDMARQVEKFLIPETLFRAGNYQFQNLYDFEKKYQFPVLFDRALSKSKSAASAKTYIILCKISDTSRRSKSIQLFLAQGYFISYAQKAKNLAQLTRWLYNSLVGSSDGLFLQGFLFEVPQKGAWKGVHFGRDLEIRADGKATPLPFRPPLGSQAKPVTGKLSAAKNDSLRFSLKNLIAVEAVQVGKN